MACTLFMLERPSEVLQTGLPEELALLGLKVRASPRGAREAQRGMLTS